MILIACVGNIFLGDDGFGVEVARRLASRTLPPEVCVKDYGIRSFDLAYALMEPWDLTILVDACARGDAPGTVYLIEPDPVEDAPQIEPHGMNPMSVLRLVKSLGGTPGRILIVGCEPAELGSEYDGQMGLSEPVEAAVEEAIALLESLWIKVV
ncbi:MAG: hydrogenase maturation protease [Bryobacteraceae bacterium]|jgi:hydrogenase maturation protease